MAAPGGIEAITRKKAWPLYLVTAFLVWYAILGLVLELDQPELRYFVTDWMVTYSGGFVRRGLLGQCLITFSDLTHINPMALLSCARIAVQVAFLALFGFQLLKNQKALGLVGLLVLLTNPFIGFYSWYQAGSFDLAFVLLTVLNLSLSQTRSEQQYKRFAFALFLFGGVFVALCHEAILFLCLPCNILITCRALSGRKVIAVAAIYGPPILAALAAARFHGSHSQVVAITSAWADRGARLPSFNVLRYLTNSLTEQLKDVAGTFSPVGALLWGLSDILSLFPLALLYRFELQQMPGQNQACLRRQVSDFILIPILCTLPLYFIAGDWHRWISLPLTTGIICLLMKSRRGGLAAAPLRGSPSLLTGLIALCLLIRPVALYTPRLAVVGGLLPSTVAAIHRHVAHSRFGLR